jgi:CelD/BcsL family acetyltransferase involved in cellulose biosynthesis
LSIIEDRGARDDDTPSRRRNKPSVDIAWSVVRNRSALGLLADEWAQLYHASGTPNPFAHPAWVTTWLEHFTREEDLYAVVGRDPDGAMVAFAPFHLRRPRLSSPFPGACLRLAGMGASELLTEIPEILVTGGHPHRKVMRSLVEFLLADCADDFDWAEFSLPAEMGWFESDWIVPDAERRGARFAHQATLAFVVVELPADGDTFRKGMKRNIREAVRRSNNRLAKLEAGWDFVLPQSGEDMRDAVDALIGLHGARSEICDKEEHGSYIDSDAVRGFVRSAAVAMYEAGAATLPRIRVGGEDAAARLVLHGNGSLFFSLSGLERDYWDLGLGTQINLRCLQDAIERGDSVANLSQNPDASKLRWSERVELHNEFRIVSPRRGARFATSLFVLRRALRAALNLWR